MTRTGRASWSSWAVCAAWLVGCGPFVAKDDYRAYRATRTAADLDAQLVAMAAYVRAHRDGHYIQEIEAARRQHDTATFERGKASREGLEHYLRVFADGAFASQAQARLSAMAMIERRRAEDAERAAQDQEARRARERELRRTWVTRFVAYWGGALSGLSNWGAPIPDVAAANPRFSAAFGRSPRPRCTEQECLKYYDGNYGIPVPGGTRMERTMRLALRLHLQQGRLVGAELLMPAYGFSRWYELEQRELVIDDDPEQRARAVQWAMEKLRTMVAGLGPEVAAIEGFVMAPIVAPGIDPTGEQIDTSVDDPSLPSNRIVTGAPTAPADADDAAAVQRALEPEAAPDMVVGAIEIGPSGRVTQASGPTAAAQAPGASTDDGADSGQDGEGEVMVLDALSIPSGKPAAGGGSPAPTPEAAPQPAMSAAASLEPVPERVEAFRVGGLEIALRAAAVGAGPGFDLLSIRLATAGIPK